MPSPELEKVLHLLEMLRQGAGGVRPSVANRRAGMDALYSSLGSTPGVSSDKVDAAGVRTVS